MNNTKKVFEKNYFDIKYTIKRKQQSRSHSKHFFFILGQEKQNVQDLEIEKLKLENRKLHGEIERIQLEKETLRAAKNLNNAKLMLILKENQEIAYSLIGKL